MSTPSRKPPEVNDPSQLKDPLHQVVNSRQPE